MWFFENSWWGVLHFFLWLIGLVVMFQNILPFFGTESTAVKVIGIIWLFGSHPLWKMLIKKIRGY